MSRSALCLLLLLAGAGVVVWQVAGRTGGEAGGVRPERTAAPRGGERGETGSLADVRSWAYQLQGLEAPGAIDRLVRAPVDLFVLEPTTTVRGSEDFPIRGVVRRLHARARSSTTPTLCLAYLNVGQAEDYRTYWQEAWRPGKEHGDEQGFVLCEDPDGWEGNFPVAYWDPAWQRLLFGSSTALLDRVLAQGFDGVYLDWVLGFVDETVAAAARRADVDPARAMAELIRDLRAHARKTHPDFIVVAQNPGDLLDRVPEVAGWMDGIAQEGLLFRGAATSDWEAPEAVGKRRPDEGEGSSVSVARLLRRYHDAGLPVFTVDYARTSEDRAEAVALSRGFGFVPCVTRTPLDRIPDHVFSPVEAPR